MSALPPKADITEYDKRRTGAGLPLQKKADNKDNATRPKQSAVIGRRAIKPSCIGDRSARASEFIQALDRRPSDHLAIEVLPPDDRGDRTNCA